jgi:hypothetical protein
MLDRTGRVPINQSIFTSSATFPQPAANFCQFNKVLKTTVRVSASITSQTRISDKLLVLVNFKTKSTKGFDPKGILRKLEAVHD